MNAQKLAVTAGVFALVGIAIYIYWRGAGGVAKDATKAAVNVAAGAVEGTTKGVAEAIGIPDTDMAKCQQALAAGDYWDASFYCPVGTLVSGVFGKAPPKSIAAGVSFVPANSADAPWKAQ